MSELAAFQDRFADALRDGAMSDGAALTGIGPSDRGLRVHRNTVFKALIDALRDNYPTVARLVGDEWFAASASAFLSEHLPREPTLATFGEHFPSFLGALPAAADLVYLPGVARIDRFWTEAHVAADADVATPQMLVGAELFDMRLSLHPATRIGWFEDPAPTIWRLNRPPAPEPETQDVEWIAQGMLVARPQGQVETMVLDRAGFVFLDTCRDGATLGEATMAALDIEPDADLMSHIARFVTFGVFAPNADFPSPIERVSS